MDMYEIVMKNPVLAILRNVPLEQTLDYAEAIVAGGIRFFEVALNSKDGLKQISVLRKRYGDRNYSGIGGKGAECGRPVSVNARDADRCSGILREKQCEITARRFNAE